MTDYLTLVGTVLNKQPRQLFGIATRTVKSSVLPRLPIDIDARYEDRIPDELTPQIEPIRENTVRLQESTVANREEYSKAAEAAVDGEITFLNETLSFENGEAVSVDADSVMGQSLHWQLKFWGFEHLKPVWLSSHDPSEVSDEVIATHQAWLDDWMDDHPIAAATRYLRRYWMPHSVSLRILNWARYDSLFADRLDDTFREGIQRFVYKNAAFLSDNVEHGVGGNHLVENAVALIVAGSYFERDDWLAQGKGILERAATDQFFEDGGHVERSPMYHLIVTQRYLTSADLLAPTDRQSDVVDTTAEDAVGFAAAIRPPDGKIPLLNDSALGEALAIDELDQYASACDLAPSLSGSARRDCPETGYHWLGDGDDCLLAVGGDLVVKHLPAHAHAHPAQVLAWVDGRPVLTDTGVFEYEAGHARWRARSVRSHNTVQVDGAEPVLLGDSFHWFGNVTTDVYWDDNELLMAYEVGGIGQPSYSHRRRVEHDADGWTITDDLTGFDGTATARFHVHPTLTTGVEDEIARIVDATTDEHALTVRLLSGDDLTVETAPYYPQYGKLRERDVVTVSRSGDGQIKTRFDRH